MTWPYNQFIVAFRSLAIFVFAVGPEKEKKRAYTEQCVRPIGASTQSSYRSRQGAFVQSNSCLRCAPSLLHIASNVAKVLDRGIYPTVSTTDELPGHDRRGTAQTLTLNAGSPRLPVCSNWTWQSWSGVHKCAGNGGGHTSIILYLEASIYTLYVL